MKEKYVQIGIIIVIIPILILTIYMCYTLISKEESSNNNQVVNDTTVSDNSTNTNTSSKIRATVIEHDITYSKDINSSMQAISEIKSEAERQRKKYNNPEIKKLENEMEKKYGITAVTLGEIDIQTANAINEAFDYMYKKFPKLKGTLTNLTLGNLDNSNDVIAKVTTPVFITIPESNYSPRVVKHEMTLSARDFLNQTRMQNIIKGNIASGHWKEGSNIQSVIVHEIGHSLIDVIRFKRYELENLTYITDENYNNYLKYIIDEQEVNQTTNKEIVTNAYKKYGEDISYDDFINSISGYASQTFNNGSYKYGETCAEACADYYLNGENCSKASKLIMEEITNFYNQYM